MLTEAKVLDLFFLPEDALASQAWLREAVQTNRNGNVWWASLCAFCLVSSCWFHPAHWFHLNYLLLSSYMQFCGTIKQGVLFSPSRERERWFSYIWHIRLCLMGLSMLSGMTQGQSENSWTYIITAIIRYWSLTETNWPAILSLLEASDIILISD